MFDISLRTVYRRVEGGKFPSIEDPDSPGTPLRPVRIPIVALHEMYPQLKVPYQLPLFREAR